ncbi:hypothetical protein KDAU_66690 [Dictyobacter aurantiacus]|uniref:Uncharacterized protein n=1 Tax=Dictyobacter aurantiacus TaxID=1936993 RepID=A0A401ZRC7_9CHLR|nr:hypothetical protein KDAU_66690 [Dictyobacter aurantiacus]
MKLTHIWTDLDPSKRGKITLTLAKMKEPLALVWSRPLPEGVTPSSVTVSKDASNRYFVSLLVEESIAHLTSCGTAMGAGLGLKSFVVLSDGEIVGNPKFFHKDEKNWQRRNADTRKRKKGPRIGTKRATKLPEYTPGLLIDVQTSSTSFLHD